VSKEVVLSSLFVFLLNGFFEGCSDVKLEEEAAEILSEQEEENIAIRESVDGLQFTQNKTNDEVEASVGFSQQGHLSYKGDFKDDKPHGLWTTFFPDGKPRWRGHKKEGLNHGQYTMWYENGRKRMEGTYENGQKHGRSMSWHPNGVKWQYKFHQFGEPKGTWSTWDNQGNLISKVNHEKPSEENASELIPY
jgi:antitoxin component YwqK of YwqJK toxin-antitoxin module